MLAASPVEQLDGALLGGVVQAEQRLIAQQQVRVIGQGLGLPHALLLAAGQGADASGRQAGRPDLGEGGVDGGA